MQSKIAIDKYAARVRRADLHDDYSHLLKLRGRKQILSMSPPDNIHITFAVTRGSVKMIYNGIILEARPGDIYDIFANNFLLFTDATEDATMTILCVPTRTFRIIFRENIFPLPHAYIVQSWFGPAVSQDPDYFAKFCSHLEQLELLLKHKDATAVNNIKRVLVKYIILDLCDAAMRRRGFVPVSVSNSMVELSTAFHHLFYGVMRPNRDIAWYAEKLGVTDQYFSNAIKTATGHTPSHIINNCVCRSICIDLCHRLPLSEIAEKYDFSSVADLNSFISDRLGTSASELQNLIYAHDYR